MVDHIKHPPNETMVGNFHIGTRNRVFRVMGLRTSNFNGFTIQHDMFLTPGMKHLLPPGHRGMVEFVLLSKLGSNQFEKLDETGTFEILHECFNSLSLCQAGKVRHFRFHSPPK